MMKIVRIVLSIALVLLCVFLVHQLYKTIEEPIVFEELKAERDEAVISKLEYLRDLQLAFRAEADSFADDWDKLALFIASDSISYDKIIGDPNDTTVVSKTITIKIPAKDSLKNDRFSFDSIAYVPFSNKKFDIQAGTIVKNELDVRAFEISTPYTVIYNGLIQKYYADKINEVIRVGSMKDGTTSGNW